MRALSYLCVMLALVSGRDWIVTYVDFVPRPEIFDLVTNFFQGDQGDEMQIYRYTINNIERGAFGGKPLLKTMRIKDCIIQRIHAGAFNNSLTLEELEMSNCSLRTLNFFPDAFEENCCPRLRKIILSGNDMNEIHIDLLKWLSLEHLILASCSLRSVPAFATRNYSRNLLNLDLSSNRLRNLDNPKDFYYLENLKELILSDNVIEQIEKDIFKPLSRIKRIDLSRNRISRFSDGLFQDLPTLEDLELMSNRIEHVSAIAFRGTKLRKLDLSGNKFTYLPDGFCGSLRSSGGALSTFYFGGNPWQCACLNDIMVEAQRLNIQYMKDGEQHDGSRPVCGAGRRFVCLRANEYLQAFDSNNIKIWADQYRLNLKKMES